MTMACSTGKTREAAVKYAAYRAWASAQDHRWRADRVRRSWEKFAAEMREFFAQCGIDVTQPPAPETKRVLISSGRERELRLAAEAEAKAAKAPAVERMMAPRGTTGSVGILCDRGDRSADAAGAKEAPVEGRAGRRCPRRGGGFGCPAIHRGGGSPIEYFAWGEKRWFDGAPYRKAWNSFIAREAVPTDISVPDAQGLRGPHSHHGDLPRVHRRNIYEEPCGGCGVEASSSRRSMGRAGSCGPRGKPRCRRRLTNSVRVRSRARQGADPGALRLDGHRRDGASWRSGQASSGQPRLRRRTLWQDAPPTWTSSRWTR